MKIVCISDTHSLHASVPIPDGDVLIHAGDMTGHGVERDIIELNTWLGTQPHRYKIVCPGNHDTLFEEAPAFARSLLSNARVAIDEELVIEGFRFYFSPWTPEFGRWSFMLPRGPGMRSVWSAIPEGLDVLVTHGPPHGILDYVPGLNRTAGVHAGCKDLLGVVQRVKPKAHVFGHIHEGSGITKRDDTLFVNAAICDASYRPINPAREITL
jgi:predicted phosphodiesterase